MRKQQGELNEARRCDEARRRGPVDAQCAERFMSLRARVQVSQQVRRGRSSYGREQEDAPSERDVDVAARLCRDRVAAHLAVRDGRQRERLDDLVDGRVVVEVVLVGEDLQSGRESGSCTSRGRGRGGAGREEGGTHKERDGAQFRLVEEGVQLCSCGRERVAVGRVEYPDDGRDADAVALPDGPEPRLAGEVCAQEYKVRIICSRARMEQACRRSCGSAAVRARRRRRLTPHFERLCARGQSQRSRENGKSEVRGHTTLPFWILRRLKPLRASSGGGLAEVRGAGGELDEGEGRTRLGSWTR